MGQCCGQDNKGPDELEFNRELTPTSKGGKTIVFVDDATAETKATPRSARKQEDGAFSMEEMMVIIKVQSMIKGWI